MKRYIASFENGKGENWDIVINAKSYDEARREARRAQGEFGKLWSVRLAK